jgi:putative inorganic carbon (hco3(-)) transporter
LTGIFSRKASPSGIINGKTVFRDLCMGYIKDNKLIQHITANPFLGLVTVLLVSVSMYLLSGPDYRFAVIPALAVPFVFLIWKKPEIGFYTILFLTPFDEFTVLSETYRFVTIPKLFGVLTIIVLFVHYMVYHNHNYDIRSNLWKWLLAFWLVSLVSALLSEYHFNSYNTLRRYITGFAFFFMAVAFLTERDFKLRLPGLIVFSTSVGVLLSIFGYFTKSPIFMMSVRSEFSRITGGAGDPNEFAVMIAFALPLFAFMIYKIKSPLKRFLLSLFFFLCIIAVINTYSRTGAVIMLTTLLLIALQYFCFLRPKKIGFVLLALTIVIICAVFVIPDSYWNRQKTMTARETDFSVGRRFSYLVVAYENFKKNPILGTGPGTFRDLYGASRWTLKYAREDESPKRVAHNTYVEVLAGSGLTGLSFFILIIGAAIRNYYYAWKQVRQSKDPELEHLILACIISFWVILIAFLFLTLYNHKYFWLSLAISQVCLRISKQKRPESLIT